MFLQVGPSSTVTKQCSYFLMGLLQLATLPCSAFGSASHAHSLNLVGYSLRLPAVHSGDLEANMWHRILVGRCHRLNGGKFAARDGEPSATGVAISAACNVSTLILAFRSQAFSGLLSLRVHERTQRGYRSTQVHAELISCVLLIWTRFTCYTGLVGSFSLSASPAAGCFPPSDGSLRLQFFPLLLKEKAGVPESRKIHKLCRQ